MCATGNPAELLVWDSVMLSVLAHEGLRLVLRDVADEYCLLVQHEVHAPDRHALVRPFQYMAGSRGWLMSINALLIHHGRVSLRGDAFDDLSAASALMFAGDLAAAGDRLVVAASRLPDEPWVLAMVIHAHLRLARMGLDTAKLDEVHELVEQHAAQLPPGLLSALRDLVAGSKALLTGELDSAIECFRGAETINEGGLVAFLSFTTHAVESRLSATYVRAVTQCWTNGEGRPTTIWRVLRKLSAAGSYNVWRPSVRERAALRLEYLWPALEVWARRCRDINDVLRVTFFLKEAVDAVFQPLGRNFTGLMARWAPSLYEKLRHAVCEKIGEIPLGVPEGRALSAGLRTIEQAWKDGHAELAADQCCAALVRVGGSRRRDARKAARGWYDDASIYAMASDFRDEERRPLEARAVVAYGYAGGPDPAPVSAELAFDVAGADGNVHRVMVDTRERQQKRRARSRPASTKRALLFLGSSMAAKRVRALIEMASKCDYPTLIVGETGAGKDLVAECIHSASAVGARPLVVSECAALAESLLESELFGHERGAFTGAHERHCGLFERANGSSLVLDDVDSMPARMQVALLRVLETGEYRPLGAATPKHSRFRLISSASPRLSSFLESGLFRQDLFYRISTLKIHVPPLRDRDGDAAEIATEYARSIGYRITRGALRVVSGFSWPGNVRQLRHCIQAATLHGDDRSIGECAMAHAIGGAAPTDEYSKSALDVAWYRAIGALEPAQRFGAVEYARAAQISRRTAQRHLARLLGEGRIVRVGAGRATSYELGASARP
jgi:DNA-binding NtrC family response regulator